MSTSTKTYDLGEGTITVTVDVDIFHLGRAARDKLFELLDNLHEMALATADLVAAKTAPVAPPNLAPVPPNLATIEQAWACKHCGRSFRRVQGKAIHEKYCAPGSAPPKRQTFACSVCGEEFTDPRKKAAHQRDCVTARAKQEAVDRLILEREKEMAMAAPPAPLSIVDRLEGDTPSLECRHCAKTFRTVDGRLRHGSRRRPHRER